MSLYWGALFFSKSKKKIKGGLKKCKPQDNFFNKVFLFISLNPWGGGGAYLHYVMAPITAS